MYPKESQKQRPKKHKLYDSSFGWSFSTRKRRKLLKSRRRRGRELFSNLPTELLGLILSFQSLRHLHTVGFLICRTVSKCLRKNGKVWPTVYHSWFEYCESVLPVQFHGNYLQEVWLGQTTDKIIQVLQTSQTLTRLGTFFCSLKERRYSELAFLTELKLESGSCTNHCLSDFACPRLTKLYYLCSTRNEKNKEGERSNESLFSRLEELTTNNVEASKLFKDWKNVKHLSFESRSMWKNLKYLHVIGDFKIASQTILLNSIACAPLTSLNLNLDFENATKMDLQIFKTFNLNCFCIQASLLRNSVDAVFSMICGLTCLKLNQLQQSEDQNLLTCLERLDHLQVLCLSYRKIWVQHEIINLCLGKLDLKRLEILNLQQQRVCITIQSVDFLLLVDAKRLCQLPLCNTVKKIQIENAMRLNLALETGNKIQISQLQELNLLNSVKLISRQVLKRLKSSSQLRFLSLSWYHKFNDTSKKRIKTQMKRTCKKLGIFLSWNV